MRFRDLVQTSLDGSILKVPGKARQLAETPGRFFTDIYTKRQILGESVALVKMWKANILVDLNFTGYSAAARRAVSALCKQKQLTDA